MLSEAIFLVKTLETDRAEAEEALKRQHSRRKKINKTIDSWSIWRLQEMPMAVQKGNNEDRFIVLPLTLLHRHESSIVARNKTSALF